MNYRILETIRTAEPGTREMLDALDAVNRAEWRGRNAAFIAAADEILAEREAEVVAEQARRDCRRRWNTAGQGEPASWPVPVAPKTNYRKERAA